MITSLDHVALRLVDKEKASGILKLLGYNISDTFELDFGKDGKAESLVLDKEGSPEFFMSDGDASTVIGDWVMKNGSGPHHFAFKTDNIEEDVKRFKEAGIKFTTETPLSCGDLKQIFTIPQEALGNIVIELIERKTKGFCVENVKALMESTKPVEVSSERGAIHYIDGSDG